MGRLQFRGKRLSTILRPPSNPQHVYNAQNLPAIQASKGKEMENFVPVFESKVKKLHEKVVEELSVPKKERNKKRLKKMLKELKSLKKTIRSAKKVKTCPHCGFPLWDDEPSSDADTEAVPS
ncbi:MAG: hypothetical protein WBE39_05505 [Candidatus Competibacter sp.]